MKVFLFEEKDESFCNLRIIMKVFFIWGEWWMFLKFEENGESFGEANFWPSCGIYYYLAAWRSTCSWGRGQTWKRSNHCKYTFSQLIIYHNFKPTISPTSRNQTILFTLSQDGWQCYRCLFNGVVASSTWTNSFCNLGKYS